MSDARLACCVQALESRLLLCSPHGTPTEAEGTEGVRRILPLPSVYRVLHLRVAFPDDVNPDPNPTSSDSVGSVSHTTRSAKSTLSYARRYNVTLPALSSLSSPAKARTPVKSPKRAAAGVLA